MTDGLFHQTHTDISVAGTYFRANNNPIAYCDPTGRLGKGMFQGAALGDNFEPANAAQGIGKFIGQAGMSLMPWVGQAASVMGLTEAWQQGWDFTPGASIAMAGGAFTPGGGDAIKAGVKALHGAAGKVFSYQLSYHPRIRARALEDGIGHNFPYSFDDTIMKTKPIIQADQSLLYKMPGAINKTGGVFEIGVNPQTKTIFHRQFRPD
jgi:hypothetical protein